MACVVLVGALATTAHAQDAQESPELPVRAKPNEDPSKRGELDVVALPVAFFTPDTSLGGGAMSVFSWYNEDCERPSSLNLLATYTLRRQSWVGVNPDIWLNQGRMRLWGEFIFKDYPDFYFGNGPDTLDSAEEVYTGRSFDALFGAEFEILDHTRLGPIARVRHQRLTDIDPDGQLTGGVPGTQSHLLAGAGATINYDTRDGLFAPTSGTLVGLEALQFFGSTPDVARSQSVALNGRRYFPLATGHTLAMQFWSQQTFGDTPFDLLASIGGSNKLRGYLAGRYRGRFAFLTQAEYRAALWWRFGATVFVGAGDVARHPGAWDPSGVKPIGGVGARLRVNPSGLNLRADLAYGAEPNLYFSIAEAF